MSRGDGAQRCFAARALGRIGQPSAIDTLIAALEDEDEDVRTEAAEALGLIGDRRAGPALMETLVQDPCGTAKDNAVIALARTGETRAIALLRELVRGRGAEVVWDEAEFLGGGWDDWLDVQLKAIEALAGLGAVEAVADIQSALSDELGQDVTATAVKAFARLGGPGVEALQGCLESTDQRSRRKAAEALAGIKTGAARELLAGHLGDLDAEVRLAALSALGAHDPRDSRLSSCFRDSDERLRAAAVRLCGSQHPQRLEALLDDPADGVQRAVIRLLLSEPGIARPRNLVERLRVKLRGPSEDVAVVTASALAKLAPDQALEDLTEQLLDQGCPIELRAAAARAMGELGGQGAVAALLVAADDERRRVRLEAMVALGRIATDLSGARLARDGLLAALEGVLSASDAARENDLSGPERDSDPIAAAVVRSDQPAEPWPSSTLDAILGDNSENFGPAAEAAACDLSPEDLEFVELAGRSPKRSDPAVEPKVAKHEDIRRFAARVLGEVAHGDVPPALAAVLNEADRELRFTALQSLARCAEKLGGLPADVATAVCNALTDRDREVRLAAVRALAWCDRDQAAKRLAGLLGDEDAAVRAEALRSLAGFAPAGRDLSELLGDDDPGVRLAAAQALATQKAPGALGHLVDFAFRFDGYQRRDAVRLLRGLDAGGASAWFLMALEDSNRKRAWRIAIEALEELNQGSRAETQAMATDPPAA